MVFKNYMRRFVTGLALATVLSGCDSGDIKIAPETTDASTDNSTNNSNNVAAAEVAENPLSLIHI